MGRSVMIAVAVVLLAAGAWIQIEKPEFAQRREVLKIGELRATVKDREPLPSWVGPGLIGLGLGIGIVAFTRKR